MRRSRHGTLLLEAVISVALIATAILLIASLAAAMNAARREQVRRSIALEEAANLLELALASPNWPANDEQSPSDPLTAIVADARIVVQRTSDPDLDAFERVRVTVYGGSARGSEVPLAELAGWRQASKKASQ